MWQEAELVLTNYIPNEITLGMFFIRVLTNEEQELFIITKIPVDFDFFIEQNGYPVRLYINAEIDDNVVLSEELHLNSVFDFEKLDYYNLTSLKELNTILNKFEGVLEIMLNEEVTDYEKIDDKFIIRYLTE